MLKKKDKHVKQYLHYDTTPKEEMGICSLEYKINKFMFLYSMYRINN